MTERYNDRQQYDFQVFKVKRKLPLSMVNLQRPLLSLPDPQTQFIERHIVVSDNFANLLFFLGLGRYLEKIIPER